VSGKVVMSKASDFVKERNAALKTRPKIELEVPSKYGN